MSQGVGSPPVTPKFLKSIKSESIFLHRKGATMTTGSLSNQTNATQKSLMFGAVGLALLAALAYVLIALHVLGVGDITEADGPAGIVFICAGCYLLGGLLILLRKRWLWMVGAGINALVVMAFITAYQARPAVMFSPGGLATKIAQILLELALVGLIVSVARK